MLEVSRIGSREALATRLVFLVFGLGVAAWAPLVPFAKHRLALDDASLGLLLLSLGAGSMISMPATGPLAGRYGCRAVILVTGAVLLTLQPVLATASTIFLMTVGLFMFGAALGSLGVAVNLQAITVEKASGRALMSGFHALYSVGGIAGAGGVTVLLGFGIAPLAAAVGVAAALAALLGMSAKHLLPHAGGEEDAGPLFVLPRGPVILIGLLCFTCFLAEGAVLDWSALFLALRGLDPAYGGLGYAAFAVAMSLGRLTGDRIVTALGGRWVLLYGSLCAAAGFLLPAILPSGAAALLGFVLIGLGASNIVPVLFTAAGQQTVMPSNLAVGVITTLGCTGILTGPALIGFVAEATSLPTAFGGLAAMMVVITLCSGLVPLCRRKSLDN
jgi:predicted MFS family arabinose efflux permease